MLHLPFRAAWTGSPSFSGESCFSDPVFSLILGLATENYLLTL